MQKMKVFFHRLGSLSFKRMFHNISIIHKEYGAPCIVTFFDMLWCIARYNVGYLDYLVFGFAKIKGKEKRLTFMTMNHNQSLVRKLNSRDCYYILNDKIEFNKRFADYIGRSWIDLHNSTPAQLREFCVGKSSVFAKKTETFGGQGIEKISLQKDTDYTALYKQLTENGQMLVEETITQHPEMNRLCPTSVNTMRVVTVVSPDGKPHTVYTLVRMGSGKNSVDNISSGGMYTKVGSDGVIHHPAFCDKTGEYYTLHPSTGTGLIGFHIPMYEDALRMCEKAALVEPNLKYIGWDVAFTPEGPVLVEGNNLPSYDMCQNYAFNDEKIGILPKMKELAGQDF